MTLCRTAALVTVTALLAACAAAPRITTPSVSEDEAASTQGIVTTQRAVSIRYAPSFSSPVVANAPAKTQLFWLGNQQKNGFYRVVAKDKGSAGWVRASDVQISQKVAISGFEAAAACANTLNECTVNGCATAGSPDAASNTLKHHIPSTTSVTPLSFDDLAALQQQAGDSVGTGTHIPPASRSALSNLTVANGTVSEGDAVRIIGYLTAEGTGPHPNSSGESVNCGLKGAPNNDFHIPVTADPDNSEFEAFVVEMIPQDRPTNWTVASLKAVQSKKQQVWIEGNLFYDGVHRVNADADNPLNGQPKRFSLWEVHPVTKFLVCRKDQCNPADEQDWSQL